MLDLLETVSGFVVLTAYLAVAVALPAAVVVLFVALIGTLIRAGLDAVVPRIPERVRSIRLVARIGRALRGAFIWAVGTLLFLALVGMSGQVGGPNVFAAGLGQLVVTLAAIQDIVGQWFTGKILIDLLGELIPTEGVQDPLEPIRRFQVMVALRLIDAIDPGVTTTAFRWTFAAFNTALAAFWVVFEPLRAVRKRVAVLIAPPQQQQVALSSESLERQAEMIAQALARATPQAPVTAAPSAPVAAWGRPGIARAPSIAPPAPGAVASQRVAVVTWDGELAAELERQLDGAGFAPLVMRSVAEAFASRVWPAIVFIDARHLQWLSPDRLPLLVRARLVAVTRDDLRVPAGWQLDTHAVETGADALLDLLRRRDSRRKAGSRETGA